MIASRPVSHVLAMLYLTMVCMGCAWAGYQYAQIKHPYAIWQAVFMVPHAVGVIGLCNKARWAYYASAVAISLFPLYLLGEAAIVLIKTGGSINAVSPMFIMIGLTGWLFYAFTFGYASRDYYGLLSESQNSRA